MASELRSDGLKCIGISQGFEPMIPIFRERFDTFDQAQEWSTVTIKKAQEDGWDIRFAEVRQEIDFESGKPVVTCVVRVMPNGSKDWFAPIVYHQGI